MDRAVRFLFIQRAEAVLDDEQRLLVAVVDLVERNPQAQRVDLPAPVGSLQVGVAAAEGHVAGGHFGVLRGADDHRHVVGEGDEVDGALFELFQLALLDIEGDALALVLFQLIAGVVAAGVDVHIEEGTVVHRLDV